MYCHAPIAWKLTRAVGRCDHRLWRTLAVRPNNRHDVINTSRGRVNLPILPVHAHVSYCERHFTSANPGKTSEQEGASPQPPKPPGGLIEKLFGVDSCTASESFKNRWLMVLPAFATHMCIGSPYAWSLMADVVSREIGFVAPAALDWSLLEAAFPLSIAFGTLGLSASLVGQWQMKVGPRKAMAVGSVTFGGGLLLGAAGIHYHCLELLYLGYGFLGGVGIGLAYTPPVQALMQWFPDRKGLASGLTIAGFGSGALVFAPLMTRLMKHFAVMPEYVGPADQFVTKAIDGKLFAHVLPDAAPVEVVLAGASDLAKLPYQLAEGLYIVGSGSTGAAESLAIMSACYFSVMLASSLLMKRPHPSYTIPSSSSGTTSEKKPEVFVASVPDVTLEATMRTPQFHLLGVTFFCMAAGGLGLMSVAKPMMSEVFSSALPAVVTSAFAGNFVLLLSAGNLGGRLGWAVISDKIGRRATFNIFTLTSIPIYFMLPSIVHEVATNGSVVPLYGFIGASTLAVSMMGGVYALLPPYEADLFGTKYVGPIHGRMMLFTATAALAGPSLFLKLRSISENAAIQDLLTKVDPERFASTFGASVDKASELLAAKTISIGKLLALTPPGTIDPTPYLYDSTMYTLSGMMVIAALSHGMVKPLPTKATAAEGTTQQLLTVAEAPPARHK